MHASNQRAVKEVTGDAVRKNDILNDLLDFIVENFFADKNEIDLDKSLVDEGIIDSFGLVEIATYFDEKYGYYVDEKEMTRENFGSVNKMIDFINSKLV